MINIVCEKIIRCLLDATKPMTTAEIANEINMSVSSVKHSMKEVKKIITDFNIPIISEAKKGILFDISKDQKKNIENQLGHDSDKSYSFIYRRNHILKILAKRNSNYTIQIFADDLGVSKKIIQQDLDNIEQWLSFFDITMNKTQNIGVTISGKEFDLRQALIFNNSSMGEFILDTDEVPYDLDFRISKTFYNYFITVYPKNDIRMIQNMITDAERLMDYHFEEISFMQIMEYLTVSYNRIKEKNCIMETNLMNKCRVTKEQFYAANTVLNNAIKNVNTFLFIEARCLAAQFALYGTYEMAINGSFIKREYYEEEAYKFVKHIQHMILNKKININNGLIEDLANLFEKKKMQKSYQLVNSVNMRNDIKDSSPSLYALILANIQLVETAIHVSFTENDIAYISMVIDNSLENVKIDCDALLITSFDNPTAQYLANKIKRSVEHIKIKKMINLDTLSKERFKNYDIIISTVIAEDDKILKISRALNSYDIELIENEVDKINRKRQHINTRKQELININLIRFKFKAKRKEDVIEEAVKCLVANDNTTKKFYDELMIRENFISTSLGNGVAIPHGYKKEVIKSGISVITLDKPIYWNENDKVNVIFVIALDLEDSETVKSLFRKMYELIDDKNKIDSIINANSKNQVFELLQKYEIACI